MWQAVAVSTWLDPLLAEGAHGTVHSAFRRAANLRLGDELVALQDAALGNAPLAITLAPPAGGFAGQPGWAPGDPVWVRGGFLWAGDAAIALAAPRWDPLEPCPPAPPDPALCRENAARLADWLGARGNRDGILPLVLAAGATAASAGATAAPAGGPVAALLRRDWGAVAQLVGLGAGLTPAGDDLLAGLLATLVLARAEALAAPLAAAVGAHAHRTTAVAAAMLGAAARGGLPERLGLLLHGLLHRRGEGALAHAPGALALGHSSGTDLCCGLLVGLWLLGGPPAGATG